MAKECLHSLADHIQRTSEGMCHALKNLDDEVLAKVKELPAAQQLAFYEWVSKSLQAQLNDSLKK